MSATTQKPLPETLPLCGVTRIVAGHEFICINVVHDDGHHGSPAPGVSAKRDRHYMQRRYPTSDH